MDSTPMLVASLMGNCTRLSLCFAKIGRLAWMTAPSDAYLDFRNGFVASKTAIGISDCAFASAVARFIRDSERVINVFFDGGGGVQRHAGFLFTPSPAQ